MVPADPASCDLTPSFHSSSRVEDYSKSGVISVAKIRLLVWEQDATSRCGLSKIIQKEDWNSRIFVKEHDEKVDSSLIVFRLFLLADNRRPSTSEFGAHPWLTNSMTYCQYLNSRRLGSRAKRSRISRCG